MMSNKWTFSLTSLITIIALAFVVSPAMAGDFSVAFSVEDEDVSWQKGDQGTGTSLDLNVTFGQVVEFVDAAAEPNATTGGTAKFQPGDFIMRAYDVNGAVLTFVDDSVDIGAATPPNGKDYTVAITLPATTTKIYIQLPQGAVGAADPTVGEDDDASEKKEITVTFLGANPGATNTPPDTFPDVLKIARVGESFVAITSETFMVHVLLSEDPKTEDPAAGGLTTDMIDVGDNATVNSVLKLASPADTTTAINLGLVTRTDGEFASPNDVASGIASWRDGKLHLYLVTIGTKPGDKTFSITVKDFAGMERPEPGSAQEMYLRAADSALVAGRDKLTVTTKRPDPATPKGHGDILTLKNKRVIPKDGYLVVAANPGATGITLPKDSDADNNSPKAGDRTPAEMKYNVIDESFRDLEAFLSNGGTIDLVAPTAGIYISEIMWGTDASLTVNSDSQWIEIKNDSGDEVNTEEGKDYQLIFYGPNETLPDMSVAANNIQDRVGTVDDNRVFWSVTGKGQSGRSGHGEAKTDLTAVVPTQELISMYRVQSPSDAGAAPGNTAAAWVQSSKPAVNIFGANRVGSPGDAASTPFAQPTPPKDPPVVVTIPAAVLGDILVTEIMVDTGNGRLPQWIELANFSGKEVSLDGWSVEITNHADDADVERKVSIPLTRHTLDVREGANGTRGEALLLAAWGGRSSSNLSDRVFNVSSHLKKTGRYTLLSPMGFIIELLPPLDSGIVETSDDAGNLRAEEAWEIEMDENGRSSLIRVFKAGVAEEGQEADGWVLASSTSLLQTPASWYGSDEDAGTPGVIGGGPLPVELSHFRPARDKATGQVVITWATQSELNNAGFFIKRSQQRDGEFKVVNATMVPGAGTTSEKQFYTYTDTTAQPNIVYYYQIEDVSLDGNRQTLTNGIRLKGHIGAAGKLTSTWGELKSSNE